MTAPIKANEDTAIDKVAKLIPAEIVAALTSINALVEEGEEKWVMLAFALGLLVLVYFYLKKLRGMTSIGQLAFVCLGAYPVWVCNIIASRFDFLEANRSIFGALLIFVSLFPPLLFRADTTQTPANPPGS